VRDAASWECSKIGGIALCLLEGVSVAEGGTSAWPLGRRAMLRAGG
jgi:hypothetical protein